MALPKLIIRLGRSTTLSAAVNSSTATIPIVSAREFVQGGYALIGTPNGTYEVVAVSSVSPENLTVVRGIDAAHPAASHSLGDQVVVMEPFLQTSGQLLESLDDKVSGIVISSGIDYYVSTNGADASDGLTWDTAKLTVQAAVNTATSGDRVILAPGEYDEAVTVSRGKSNLAIIGAGGRGSVFIAPSTADATAMTVEADDVTIDNVGCDGDGAGHGLVNRGRRTRIYRSKIEGGTNGIRLTLGTAAQVAAGTHGKGDDFLARDCEIAYNTTGVMLVCTDYGAVTQVQFENCRFHDNTTDITEETGSGGAAGVMFRSLNVEGCRFERFEDGTEPTAYIDLNGDNGNKGTVKGCYFPTALAGGKNTVSTGLIWAGNFHTGGLSTGQPS